MEVVFVLAPFVVVGIGVLFIAFAGGAGAAREVYLTRGGKIFTFVIVVLYLALGVVIPAAVIAGRGEAEGGVGALRGEDADHAGGERQGALHPELQELPHPRRRPSDRRHGPRPRRPRPPRPAARAERDQERRHRPGPDAGRGAPGGGRRGRGDLRLQGRRPVDRRRRRRAQSSTLGGMLQNARKLRAFPFGPSRATASMAAFHPSRGPERRIGAWGTRWPVGLGRVAEVPRSATLSARARQLTPQARRKRADAVSRCPRFA